MTHESSAHHPEIPTIPPGTRQVTLDNGLVVILREDHSAPVVSAQAWCKAGSIDEGRWLGAGLSHVLEHMLFKGTSTRPASRIDQEVQEAGGYMNAYTSFDRTVYWINVPNTGAKVAIDILCDIMQHATLPEDELEKEKDVIRREMDMGQDDPSRRSSRRLFETAYTRSPHRFTIIGYPDIFNEVKRQDLLDYYHEKYAANNCFFVLVGDFAADEVLTQIKTAYAASKSRAIPPSVLPVEPRQTAAREVVEEAPVELGHFYVAWHIPDVRHPDVAALDVLSVLLGTGHSSRLHQALRERQGVVHSVDAWTFCPGSVGLIGISGLADPENFDAARDAAMVEVETLKREPVSPAELAKAVKQFVSATLSARKTMQGQAQDLGGNWMSTGDLNFSERYLAAVKKLTPADLQRVAKAYLTPENRTVYALLPAGSRKAAVTEAAARVDKPVEKVTLENGLRLLIKEDHRLPFVEVRLVFKGGILAESPANNGITQMMARLMPKGTPTRSAEQVAIEIESLGGSLDAYGGNNIFGLNLEVMSEDLDAGLDIFADVLLGATFPEEALEREREVQLATIKAQRDQMLPSTTRLMRRHLHGPQRYGLDPSGSEESVQALTRKAVQDFHAKFVVPQNAVLAVFGDVTRDRIVDALSKRLAAWASQGTPEFATGTKPMPNGIIHVSEERDKKQGVIVVGFGGVDVHDPDRYALELLQESLSDLGSRLFMRIREQLGLAYYVGAQHFSALLPGHFSLYAGTSPDKLELVEKELLSEVVKLREEGLTEAELSRAKAKLIGQKKISRQDLASFATNCALDELYGLGFDSTEHEDERFQAVTIEHVRQAAIRHLTPGNCVVATIRASAGATADQ